MKFTSGDTVAEIKLTILDSGRTIAVRVGDRVVLSLPENPTTGVRWTMPESEDVEVLADENTPGGPGIGAAGLRVLTLRPTRSGQFCVRLSRRQAWESEETADEHFLFKIDARSESE